MNMNQVKPNSTLKTTCTITGRPLVIRAECPALQLRQILRFAEIPSEAPSIAEMRWEKAQAIHSKRQGAIQRREENLFTWNLDIGA